MTYRGCAARVEFDANDRIFVGHVAGIRDVVGFHGASVDELEAAFRESVDDYLRACEKTRPSARPAVLRACHVPHRSPSSGAVRTRRTACRPQPERVGRAGSAPWGRQGRSRDPRRGAGSTNIRSPSSATPSMLWPRAVSLPIPGSLDDQQVCDLTALCRGSLDRAAVETQGSFRYLY